MISCIVYTYMYVMVYNVCYVWVALSLSEIFANSGQVARFIHYLGLSCGCVCNRDTLLSQEVTRTSFVPFYCLLLSCSLDCVEDL